MLFLVRASQAQDMIELGAYVRDIFTLNKENKNFRIFGPDESMSNRLYHAFEVENRPWNANMYSDDDNLALDGRIMDMVCFLSICVKHGWKLIFLPDVMVSLLLTKHLSVL